jgi:hypothetical protein
MNENDRIANRARSLARSGRFAGWKEIETELGVSLSEPFRRSEINRLCQEARNEPNDA